MKADLFFVFIGVGFGWCLLVHSAWCCEDK